MENCQKLLLTIAPHEACRKDLAGKIEVTKNFVLIISSLGDDEDLLALGGAHKNLSTIVARPDKINWDLLLEETELLDQSRTLAVTHIVDSEGSKSGSDESSSTILADVNS